MKSVFSILFSILSFWATAQEALDLEECFDLVSKNYPLAKQSPLLESRSLAEQAAIGKEKLPQLSLNALASYQSDVPSLPVQVPNMTIIPPNKDQYRATLDLQQTLYNGGVITARSKIAETASLIQQQEVAIDLYTLKSRVTQLYLSALLLQENQDLLTAKQQQLEARMNEVKAGVLFGTVLESAQQTLEVEHLKIGQQLTELGFNKSDILQQLSFLIGKDLHGDILLKHPENQLAEEARERPEIHLFDLQKQQVDHSTALISGSQLPQLSAFLQGGYGNPGLNMLDNSFNTFYMAGLRLHWNLFDWNKAKTEKRALEINKEIINTRQETFLLNKEMELSNLNSEIIKMEALMATDTQIIALQEKVLHVYNAQLQNGTITPSTYIAEFTQLYEAKSNLNLHRIQRLLNQVQYNITKGNAAPSNPDHK